MFFQEITPDTNGYMIAGFVVAFVVMGLYVFSLYLRSRNLNQDLTLLEEMDESPAPVKASRSPAVKAVTKKARKK